MTERLQFHQGGEAGPAVPPQNLICEDGTPQRTICTLEHSTALGTWWALNFLYETKSLLLLLVSLKGNKFHTCVLNCVQLVCDPMDCSPPGSSVQGMSQAWTLQWGPFPPPGDLPDSGIKPLSPESLAPLSEGCPRHGHCSGGHFLLQGIFLTQGSNPCLLSLLHRRQVLYYCATWEVPVYFIEN